MYRSFVNDPAGFGPTSDAAAAGVQARAVHTCGAAPRRARQFLR